MSISEATRDHWAMMAAEVPNIVMLRQKMVKARKEYTCCWCKRTIEIGQLHEYHFYLDDDSKPMSARICSQCLRGNFV